MLLFLLQKYITLLMFTNLWGEEMGIILEWQLEKSVILICDNAVQKELKIGNILKLFKFF